MHVCVLRFLCVCVLCVCLRKRITVGTERISKIAPEDEGKREVEGERDKKIRERIRGNFEDKCCIERKFPLVSCYPAFWPLKYYFYPLLNTPLVFLLTFSIFVSAHPHTEN